MDTSFLYYLNKFVAEKGSLSTTIELLTENPLLRGGPIFICLFYLWFSTNDIYLKVRFVLGFVACITGVLISVLCQTHFQLHVRPVFDGHLDIVNVLNWDPSATGKRMYSFPSDTATLYYALVMIIFLENKRLGLLAFLWATITVGICRIAVGVHFPSDIIGGFVLGCLMILLFTRIKVLNAALARFFLKHDPRLLFLNIFLLLFSVEAYDLFPGLTQFFYVLVQIMKSI